MFLAILIEPLLMVICSLVPLIPEYGFACVTVLDVLLRHKSLWQCASWMRTRLGCLLACYLKLWYSFCFSSWRLILGYMEWNCACVMGTYYELLCCSQTSQCFSFSSCNGFLPPSFPREFNLDWDVGKSQSLHWCIEGGTGSVSAEVALFEPQ